METYTATLPKHWASALFNDDLSGMADEDVLELDRVLEVNPEWGQPTGYEDVGFCWQHDATPYGVLAGDCFEYTFLRSKT